MSRELLVVAGEASGDLHGARLLGELARLAPGVRAFGLGGGEMRAAGFEALADSSEVAVVGITEVLRVLPRVRQVFAELLRAVEARRPAGALLIDFPDFNLRLARALKRRGVPVVYYISPQVWAWRSGRVRTIARVVDRLLVLFPFEVDFYRRHGIEAVHVGHPLVDEVPALPQAWDRGVPEGGPYRLALLPGSRRSEVEALLPALLAAVRRMAAAVPIEARVIQAPSIPRERLEAAIAEALSSRAGGPPAGPAPGTIEIVAEDRFRAIADSHLAICASGTATLEVGLLGTPMVMVYRLGSWTYRLAKRLVRLPYVSLVNLVLGRDVVPELLQSEATPERIAAEGLALLADRAAIGRMRAGLAELRGRLGRSGASARAAREVAAVLGLEEAA